MINFDEIRIIKIENIQASQKNIKLHLQDFFKSIKNFINESRIWI